MEGVEEEGVFGQSSVFGAEVAIVHGEREEDIEEAGDCSLLGRVHCFLLGLNGVIQEEQFVELGDHVFSFSKQSDCLF